MKPKSSISQADLDEAVNDLSMMPYFPIEARASVMALLARMCPSKKALNWLVAECVNRVGRWPGPAELRGLLCTRFDAADGIDGYCNLPGYTAAEMEARHIERHEQLKANGWELDAEKLREIGATPAKLIEAGKKRAGQGKEREV